MKSNSNNHLKGKFRFSFLFAFLILLLVSFSFSSIPCQWSGVEKIVAVADIHGDYKNFVKILKGTKLIDDESHWTGGRTHLVQTGDIMDRGPDAKKVFDLLIELENEAEKAGGKVHMLIGNHEEMNITGISFDYPDYVTVEQFVSFLPDPYRNKKEKEFWKKQGNKSLREESPDKGLDPGLRVYWQEILKKDKSARNIYLSSFNEKYGKWILKHNAVIKINDILFVHGGISKKYSTWKLEEINNRLRDELTFFRLRKRLPFSQNDFFNPKIVYDGEGPLWYRDLATKEENVFKEDVDNILSNLNARYMVIAHTENAKSACASSFSRFKNRIWMIDTGISDYYGGHLSALIIENGIFSVWGVNDEK